jgi:hypothetical protein
VGESNPISFAIRRAGLFRRLRRHRHTVFLLPLKKLRVTLNNNYIVSPRRLPSGYSFLILSSISQNSPSESVNK